MTDSSRRLIDIYKLFKEKKKYLIVSELTSKQKVKLHVYLESSLYLNYTRHISILAREMSEFVWTQINVIEHKAKINYLRQTIHANKFLTEKKGPRFSRYLSNNVQLPTKSPSQFSPCRIPNINLSSQQHGHNRRKLKFKILTFLIGLSLSLSLITLQAAVFIFPRAEA